MKLLNRWKNFMRYMMAGIVIFLLGHVQYCLILHRINEILEWIPMQAGTAWALHFLLGTLWTHALHRTFTFRHEPKRPYWSSLARTCGACGVLWVFSTFIMVVICDIYGQKADVGWTITTVSLSIFNFVVMSRWSICNPIKDS
jgi:putative flippase GtrA